MFMSKWLMPTLTVLALGCAGPGLAAEPHAHGDTAAKVKLQLNHGKKWQTDEALRRGMSEIRAAMAEALTPIHKNVFTPAQYEALAARTQAQIDYVVSNCKLPEAADQQLHIVLEQIIDGVAEMKAATGRRRSCGHSPSTVTILITPAGDQWLPQHEESSCKDDLLRLRWSTRVHTSLCIGHALAAQPIYPRPC